MLSQKHSLKGHSDLKTTSRLILVLQLRHLLWATSKHDVYTTAEARIMHWSTVTQKSTKVGLYILFPYHRPTLHCHFVLLQHANSLGTLPLASTHVRITAWHARQLL